MTLNPEQQNHKDVIFYYRHHFTMFTSIYSLHIKFLVRTKEQEHCVPLNFTGQVLSVVSEQSFPMELK